MPLKRYEIRNEFALADPQLYNQPPNLKDDPEALLEAVAMSGFVGLLRQLGDLSEFASEIFHDLHEEVMTTSARGHGLMTRLQQLEADVPLVERSFLSQTSHSQFLRNGGIDWHTSFRMDQNQITRGDMPRFIMDSYEECRGPPRLFLLDKFDIAGAGACLKRYSDPSFYKSSSETIQIEGRREKKVRKIKTQSSYRKFGETPGSTPASNPKLHELLSENKIPTRNGAPLHVKLKGRTSSSSVLNSPTGKSYMEKYLGTCSPLSKLPYESPLRLEMEPGNSSELIPEIHEVYVTSPVNKSRKREISSGPSPSRQDMVREQSLDDLNVSIVEKGVLKSSESTTDIKLENTPSALGMTKDRKELVGHNEERKTDASSYGYRSDNVISEADNYVDAFHSTEPESETEIEERHKNDINVFMDDKKGEDSNVHEECQKLEAQYSASVSAGNSYPSDDDNDPFIEGRFSSSYSSPPGNLTETAPDGDAAAEVHRFTDRVVDRGTYTQVLDDRNSDISCDASTHPSYILDCDTDKKIFDDTSLEVLPAKDTAKDNLSNGGLETPDSVILSTESQYPKTVALPDASTHDQPISNGSACESVEDRTPADWVLFNSFGKKEVVGAPLDFFSRSAKSDTSESASTEEAYSHFTRLGSKAIYEVVNADSVTSHDALGSPSESTLKLQDESNSNGDLRQEELETDKCSTESRQIGKESQKGSAVDPSSFALESHAPSGSELFENVDDSVCVARKSESKQPAPSHLSDTTEGTVPSGIRSHPESASYSNHGFEDGTDRVSEVTHHQPLANAEPVKPFVSFPPSDNEKPTQDPQNLNEETAQPCTNPFNTQPATAAEMIRQDIPTPEEMESTSNSLMPFRYASLPSEAIDPHHLQAAALNREDGVPFEGQLVPPHNTLAASNDGSEHGLVNLEEEMMDVEDGRPNGIRKTKIPRPTDAIIKAVASHDKSMLRKVTDRALPQLEPKEDERNSLLEQIRNRSFSLKPAAVTRPSVQGPRTNLKLVAILEKANAIRQALAGSDDDEDEDNWSDS